MSSIVERLKRELFSGWIVMREEHISLRQLQSRITRRDTLEGPVALLSFA